MAVIKKSGMDEGTYLKQDNHWIYDIPLSQMLKIIFMREF